MLLLLRLLVVPALTILTACVSFHQEQEKELVLIPQTVLPEVFPSSSTLSNGNISGRIIIPEGIVEFSVISRPRAEVREGPGLQFSLLDKILLQGEEVVLFDSVDVWRKVVAVRHNISGWVHNQALLEAQTNRRPITMRLSRLPGVFAIKDIKQCYNFPSKKPLPVIIKKGSRFPLLKYSKNFLLVYLELTNSLMWLKQEDAQ